MVRALIPLLVLGSCGPVADAPDEAPDPGACSVGSAPASRPSAVDGMPFRATTLSETSDPESCVLVEDLDRDGHLDVVLGDRGVDTPDHLDVYWGVGDGTFEHTEVVTDTTPEGSCLAYDGDKDGYLDLLVGSPTGLELWRGRGDRRFASRPLPMVLRSDFNFRPPSWLLDVDVTGDGQEELLFANSGADFDCYGAPEDPGTPDYDVLVPVTIDVPTQIHCLEGSRDGWRAQSGTCPPWLETYDATDPHSAILADLDEDGSLDLVIANDFAGNLLVSGIDSGVPEDASPGSGLETYDHAMGLAMADFDGDGRQDLFLTDVGPDQLLSGTGCGTFEHAELASRVAEHTVRTVSWGAQALDVELDGDMDLFIANSDEMPEGGFLEDTMCGEELPWAPAAHYLLLNDGQGVFERIRIPHLTTERMPWKRLRAMVFDADEDGDDDILVIERGAARLLFNEAPRAGAPVVVETRRADGTAHYGARVVLQEPDGRRAAHVHQSVGMGGSRPPVVRFGVADDGAARTLEVTWPGGATETVDGVQPGDHLHLQPPR